MKISVYSIEKTQSPAVESLLKEYIKMSSRFAKLEDITLFNKQIALAQTKGEAAAQASYTQAYDPYLKGLCIALDVTGETMDSFEFASLLQESADIRFFIGGAYGFESKFIAKNQKVISLSRLTYAHKIAKAVLFEQIYRGLCIGNNHPYHK